MSDRAIVPQIQVPIVVPPLEPDQIVEHFRKIQELKKRIIDPKTDTIRIGGKDYVLKSGWRKLAFAFNLTDEILREEKDVNQDGETTWRMWVKVTAPNGRTAIGVAACSSGERDFAHDEHDPYALCHTRAKNRAISDILGLGEVSAEEMGVGTREEGRTVNILTSTRPVSATGALGSDVVKRTPEAERGREDSRLIPPGAPKGHLSPNKLGALKMPERNRAVFELSCSAQQVKDITELCGEYNREFGYDPKGDILRAAGVSVLTSLTSTQAEASIKWLKCLT
jgi:hypothetical protein